MALNNLTLSQLVELADTLTSLAKVGEDLAPLNPVFDLTPGERAKITLDAILPPLADIGGFHLTPMAARIVAESQRVPESIARAIDTLRRNRPTAAAPAQAPEPVDAPLVAGGLAEGAPNSAEPSRPSEESLPQDAAPDVATAESGGGADAAPTPAAPANSSQDGKPLPAPWTTEEDTRLVGLIAYGVVDLGMTKKAAIIAAAQALGRPEAGTAFRCAHKLKERISAALSNGAMTQAQTETPEIPTAEKADPPAQRDAAVGGHSPAAEHAPSAEVVAAAFARPMEPAPDDLHGADRDLWQHLHQNRPRWPHTAGTDLDLCVALGRGEKLPMIAADLGLDPEALKQRFATLTRPIRDAKGNVTVDGGPRLIKLLRRIAKGNAEAA